MPFKDLDEFLKPKTIKLPVHGVTYEFPGTISAKTGMRLSLLRAQLEAASASGDAIDPEVEALSDAEEAEIKGELLGAVEQKMIDDGLSVEQIRTVWFTLVAHHLYGEGIAKMVWQQKGELPAPNRAQRRATKAPSRRRGSPATSPAPAKQTAALGTKSSSTGTK